ncbi:MAG: hypothetical protein ACRCZ9_10045 [Fusobacteriaceae bacterium]
MLIATELKYIKKIFSEPQLWLESKVNHEMFYDPLARVMMQEIGMALTKVGTFVPGLHLKKLFEDKERMSKFKSLGYPAPVQSIEELIILLERYEDSSLTIKTLEAHIKKEYVRRKLKNLSLNLSECLIDSTVSEEEILRKLSVSVDNLLYDEEESVERYSTDEIVANEIQYQKSGEVQVFEKSGIALVDEICGGIPVPSLNFILGTGKSGRMLALCA